MRLMLALTCCLAAPLAAQDIPYRDDRSDGPALVASFYNAIDRQEYARAFAYFAAPPAEGYDAFASGYAATTRVELKTGPDSADADMGGVYHSVGVVLGAHQADGPVKVFTGCYLLRQSAWWKTDPLVFAPLEIESAHLGASSTAFAEAIPPDCPVP